MAEASACNAGAGLIYSDEDNIDAEGRRFDPYFKPDWDPDLLRSQNYVCHFTAIRTDLARDVGGFRRGFEGSQDHDLVLRCTEKLEPAQIRSEEHTSELQSLMRISYAVFCLKKKQSYTIQINTKYYTCSIYITRIYSNLN